MKKLYIHKRTLTNCGLYRMVLVTWVRSCWVTNCSSCSLFPILRSNLRLRGGELGVGGSSHKMPCLSSLQHLFNIHPPLHASVCFLWTFTVWTHGQKWPSQRSSRTPVAHCLLKTLLQKVWSLFQDLMNEDAINRERMQGKVDLGWVSL